MQTTCAVLTPRVVWCRATAPAGLSKLCQLLALSAWHFIAQGRSESSSKEQISARAFRSEVRVWYQPVGDEEEGPCMQMVIQMDMQAKRRDAPCPFT